MKRIAVLMGGINTERPVSLSTAMGVIAALKDLGHAVVEIDVGPNTSLWVNALINAKADVVFNALHGQYGEDGCVQGILNYLHIPYTHSGVLASALAMHKVMAKSLFRGVGIPVPETCVVDMDTFLDRVPFPFPYILKPIQEGSSFGFSVIASEQDKVAAYDAWSYGKLGLAEPFIPGRDLYVSLMGSRSLGVLEGRPVSGKNDYEAKYAPGAAEHIFPAPIPSEVYAYVEEISCKSYEALGCRGIARTDLRYDDSQPGIGGVYLLELNTQPGMTPTSFIPEMAAHVGISYQELVAWMLDQAAYDTMTDTSEPSKGGAHVTRCA